MDFNSNLQGVKTVTVQYRCSESSTLIQPQLDIRMMFIQVYMIVTSSSQKHKYILCVLIGWLVGYLVDFVSSIKLERD